MRSSSSIAAADDGSTEPKPMRRVGIARHVFRHVVVRHDEAGRGANIVLVDVSGTGLASYELLPLRCTREGCGDGARRRALRFVTHR